MRRDPAVYLDKPDPAHLESELPAIAFFHDYELAAALELRLDMAPDWRLRVVRDGDLPIPRALPILFHAPVGEPPRSIELGDRPSRVQRLGHGLGRLVLPAG